MNSKLSQSKEEANQLKDEINEALNKKQMFQFGNGFDEVKDKIDSFKKRMSRLIGTAMIFSLIRSQLTGLRNDFISMLKSNNTFGNSLNQIKANLMTAFAPIYNACLPAINSLMNAISKITGTIAVFVSNLFGQSLEESKNQAKGLSKALKDTSKNGKKASGSLASFDKLEVVQDTSSSSGGANKKEDINYGGELTYSQKLLDFLNKTVEVLGKVWDFVKRNKEAFIALAGVIATAFVIGKIVNFLSGLKNIRKGLDVIRGIFVKVGKESFNKVGTGITVAIAGFVLLLKNISDLIDNWDNLSTKEKLIKAGMAALGAAAIALGYAIATGISAATLGIGAIIAAVTAAVTLVASLIIKFATQKDAILSVTDAQNKLTEAQNNYVAANESYINAVDKNEEAMKQLNEAEKSTGLSGENLFNQVTNGTLTYENMTNQQKEVYKAYIASQSAQDELKKSTEALIEAKKEETIASFENQLAIAAETDNYDEYKQSVVDAYNEGKLSAEEARDLIEKSMSRMSDASQETFMEDLPSDIKEGMDPDRYQTWGQKLKNWFGTKCSEIGEFFSNLFTKTIPEKLGKLADNLKTFFKKTLPNLAITGVEMLVNSIISMFEGLINMPIDGINKLIKKANEIPMVDINLLPNVKLNRVSIPRLATGAVIPPRHEFNAILGDQKHGTNIETPVNLMAKTFDERLEKFFSKFNGLANDIKEIVFKNFTIVAQFGDRNFQQLVLDAVRLTEKEIGKPLFVS